NEVISGYRPDLYASALKSQEALNGSRIKEKGAPLFLRQGRRAVGFQVHARRGVGGFSARTGGDAGGRARHPILSLPAGAPRPYARHADRLSMHSLPPEAF